MKLLKNLLTLTLSLAVFLGGAEATIRVLKGHKIKTYFEDQTEKVLGSPVAPKKPGEIRIFIFGGSAAYGFPLSERYSIAAWLRKSFTVLLPDRDIKVVNCGWPGKASHQVLEGTVNVMKYQPDLFVIYSGHNDATTVNRLYTDNALYRLGLRLKFRSALYRYFSARLDHLRRHLVYGKGGHVEKRYREEVIAQRVYQKAEVDDADYRRILDRYQKNMTAVIRYARKHKVKVLFLNLPSNLHEIPPAFSVHRPGLEETALTEWGRLWQEAQRLETAGQWPEAAELLKRAESIDPAYAELHYRLGLLEEKIGKLESAKKELIWARDSDARPWRAKSSLNHLIRQMAEAENIWFLNLVAVFEKLSPHGMIGESLIHDDVHPSHRAQQLIALQILRSLYVHELIPPKSSWDWAALQRARKDTSDVEWQVPGSLDAYQYVLRGLHLWQEGRYRELVPDLEKGLEMMPSFIESYAFLGDAYQHLGETQKAIEAFERLASKNHTLFEDLLKRYPDLEQSYSQCLQAHQRSAITP